VGFLFVGFLFLVCGFGSVGRSTSVFGFQFSVFGFRFSVFVFGFGCAGGGPLFPVRVALLFSPLLRWVEWDVLGARRRRRRSSSSSSRERARETFRKRERDRERPDEKNTSGFVLLRETKNPPPLRRQTTTAGSRRRKKKGPPSDKKQNKTKTNRALLLKAEEDWVRATCDAILAHKPDVVLTEKGLSDLVRFFVCLFFRILFFLPRLGF